MGNQIGLQKGGERVDYLKLSNSMTSKFLMTLVVAGTAIAASDWERRLIIYLAWKDQDVFGIGTVGFDINEMPWTPENLAAEKTFMLEVATAAKAKSGWKKLGFEMTAETCEVLFESLDKFISMINDLRPEDISQGEAVDERRKATTVHSGLCDQHGIFKNEYGCFICHSVDGYKEPSKA